jgi:hypothetical protein
MEIRIKNGAGAVMLLSGLPAMAQEVVTLKASTAAGCASCPPVSAAVAIPGDPTWFIAGVIVGAGLGFLAAKVLGNKKQQ